MYIQQLNKAHYSPMQHLALLNFLCSRLVLVGCAETSLGNAEKYWPSLKVRDLYSLRQVSALKKNPVPAKYRETNLVILWVEDGLKTTIFLSIRKCMTVN
jgi:hypothetical protein